MTTARTSGTNSVRKGNSLSYVGCASGSHAAGARRASLSCHAYIMAGEGLLYSAGAAHARQRARIAPAFHFDALRVMGTDMTAAAAGLTEQLVARGINADVRARVCGPRGRRSRARAGSTRLRSTCTRFFPSLRSQSSAAPRSARCSPARGLWTPRYRRSAAMVRVWRGLACEPRAVSGAGTPDVAAQGGHAARHEALPPCKRARGAGAGARNARLPPGHRGAHARGDGRRRRRREGRRGARPRSF